MSISPVISPGVIPRPAQGSPSRYSPAQNTTSWHPLPHQYHKTTPNLIRISPRPSATIVVARVARFSVVSAAILSIIPPTLPLVATLCITQPHVSARAGIHIDIHANFQHIGAPYRPWRRCRPGWPSGDCQVMEPVRTMTRRSRSGLAWIKPRLRSPLTRKCAFRLLAQAPSGAPCGALAPFEENLAPG